MGSTETALDSRHGLCPRWATRRDNGPLSTNFYDTSDRKTWRNPDTRGVAVNQRAHIHWIIPLVDCVKRGGPRVRGIVKSLADVMSLQCELMTEDSRWLIFWRFSRTEPCSAITGLRGNWTQRGRLECVKEIIPDNEETLRCMACIHALFWQCSSLMYGSLWQQCLLQDLNTSKSVLTYTVNICCWLHKNRPHGLTVNMRKLGVWKTDTEDWARGCLFYWKQLMVFLKKMKWQPPNVLSLPFKPAVSDRKMI